MDRAMALLKDDSRRRFHCGILPALLCLDMKALQMPRVHAEGKPKQDADCLSAWNEDGFIDENPKKLPDSALRKRIFTDDEEVEGGDGVHRPKRENGNSSRWTPQIT